MKWIIAVPLILMQLLLLAAWVWVEILLSVRMWSPELQTFRMWPLTEERERKLPRVVRWYLGG